MNKGILEMDFEVLKDMLIKEYPQLKYTQLNITCADVDNFKGRIKAQYITDKPIEGLSREVNDMSTDVWRTVLKEEDSKEELKETITDSNIKFWLECKLGRIKKTDEFENINKKINNIMIECGETGKINNEANEIISKCIKIYLILKNKSIIKEKTYIFRENMNIHEKDIKEQVKIRMVDLRKHGNIVLFDLLTYIANILKGYGNLNTLNIDKMRIYFVEDNCKEVIKVHFIIPGELIEIE